MTPGYNTLRLVQHYGLILSGRFVDLSSMERTARPRPPRSRRCLSTYILVPDNEQRTLTNRKQWGWGGGRYSMGRPLVFSSWPIKHISPD